MKTKDCSYAGSGDEYDAVYRKQADEKGRDDERTTCEIHIYPMTPIIAYCLGGHLQPEHHRDLVRVRGSGKELLVHRSIVGGDRAGPRPGA